MKILLLGEDLRSSLPKKNLPSTLECIETIEGRVPDLNSVLICHDNACPSNPEGWIVAVIHSGHPQPHPGRLQIPLAFWKQDAASVIHIALEWATSKSQLRALSDTLSHVEQSHRAIEDHASRLIDALETHIDVAAEIQRSLLPRTLPKIAGTQLVSRFFPSIGVGGDYFDIFEFGDKKRFGFLIAESENHGMAAALLSALLKIRIEQIREDFTSPSDFIGELSRLIQHELPNQTADLHLLYGILERASLRFEFASAGRLVPFWWRQGGERTQIPVSTSSPIRTRTLGALPIQKLALAPGDLLVLSTGGLEKLSAPSDIASWIESHIDPWETLDVLDIQNELTSLVRQSGQLQQDVTVLQLRIEPGTLFLRK